MTTGRPNFFILLGLNPDAVWNQVTFENALREKRNQWSRDGQGVAKKALVAQQNLALIPDIRKVLEEPKLREEEAAQARVELASGRKARYEEFEKQLAYINAKDTLEQAELNKFIDDFKDILSAKEISDRVKVKVSAPTATVTKTTQQYDPTKIKDIADRLQIIHMSTLYELLERSPKTSSLELYQAAEDLYKDMVHRVPKTAEVTAKTELSGLAREVFKTDDTRNRYDESLRQSSLNRLLKGLDDIMNRSPNKEVHQKQVALFLSDAQKQGWKEKEAFDRLKEHVIQRRWIMVAPAVDNEAQKILCGNKDCGNLNDKNQRFCTKCKQELYIDCPDCGQRVSCEDRACGNCGFAAGNRYLVDSYLEEFQTLLETGELSHAQEILEKAEACWQPKKQDTRDKRWQTIASYKAEVKRLVDVQQQVEQDTAAELQKLINHKQFFTARQLLATKGSAISQQEVQQRIVDAAIMQAQDLLKQIQKPSISQDEKIDHCRRALLLCTDYKEARDLLKTMPPSPPANLQAKVRDTVVSLSWDASPTRNVIYKIVCKSRARPNSAKDGKVLSTVTGQTYDDSLPESGVPLYYAVFAEYEQVTSDQAAIVTQPVLLIQDVLSLSAQVDTHQVKLSWEPPPNVQTVVVLCKKQLPPSSIQDGTWLAECSPQQKEFIDRSVQNEQVYYYGCYCQFKNHEGRLITSAGKFVRAIPETAPEPIKYLEITDTRAAHHYEIQISWRPPKKGRVVILKSAQPLHQEGKTLPEADLGKLGKILEDRADRVTENWTQSGAAYYTPVVIFQKTGYMGTSQRYTCVDNVQDLRHQNLGTAIRLHWKWPENCQEVLISYNAKGRPSPNDPNATTRKVSRAEYDHIGYFDVRGTLNQKYYINVAAVIKQGEEKIVAQGVHVEALLATKIVLAYEIKNPTLFRKRRTLHIMPRTPGSLPALLLIGRRDRLPFRKTDGDLLHRIEPTLIGENEKELVIELSEKTFPPRTFGKLFLEDDSMYEVVSIHHPSEDKLRLS